MAPWLSFLSVHSQSQRLFRDNVTLLFQFFPVKLAPHSGQGFLAANTATC